MISKLAIKHFERSTPSLFLDLNTDSGLQTIYVNAPPPTGKKPSLKHHVVGGFYETGTVVCISLSVNGFVVAQQLINPLVPRSKAQLNGLAKQGIVPIIYVHDGEFVEQFMLIHMFGIKKALLNIINTPIAPLIKRDWDKSVELFNNEPSDSYIGI